MASVDSITYHREKERERERVYIETITMARDAQKSRDTAANEEGGGRVPLVGTWRKKMVQKMRTKIYIYIQGYKRISSCHGAFVNEIS